MQDKMIRQKATSFRHSQCSSPLGSTYSKNDTSSNFQNNFDLFKDGTNTPRRKNSKTFKCKSESNLSSQMDSSAKSESDDLNSTDVNSLTIY